jgi:hypothetical protein
MALGRFERDIVRSVFPFYAWFRVITLLTAKLPLTHPLKATLLARLGQAGAQSALEEIGLSEDEAINLAKGFVTIGQDEDGRVRGFSTTSINPFATVAALQDSVAALANLPLYAAGVKQPEYGAEPAWAALPGVNPIFDVLIRGMTNTRSGNRYGLLGAVPQVELGKALAGRQYESPTTLYDRDTYDQLLRYLGVPYARVSRRRVRELSKR